MEFIKPNDHYSESQQLSILQNFHSIFAGTRIKIKVQHIAVSRIKSKIASPQHEIIEEAKTVPDRPVGFKRKLYNSDIFAQNVTSAKRLIDQWQVTKNISKRIGAKVCFIPSKYLNNNGNINVTYIANNVYVANEN